MKHELLIGFCGDVLVDRDRPDEAFDLVRSELARCDLVFGNFEGVLTDSLERAPSAVLPTVVPTRMASGIANAGFHVVSIAQNHIMDAGARGLRDTISGFSSCGVATVGAGENLRHAHEPAVLVRQGWSVSVCAYASVIPFGYEARPSQPGAAVVRGRNLHVGSSHQWEPGVMGRVESVPLEEDLRELRADITRCAKEHDLVVASFHWGDWTRPWVVTDHERQIARVAIDCGADLVLGHHHHSLRGMEWYKGRPIFYGLGHFVFDVPDAAAQARKLGIYSGGGPGYGQIYEQDGWPYLPLHEDTRLTMLGWMRLSPQREMSAGFIPCKLNSKGQVAPHGAGSEHALDVVRYLERANKVAHLPTKMSVADSSRFERLPYEMHPL